jgi:hypothetical protein
MAIELRLSHAGNSSLPRLGSWLASQRNSARRVCRCDRRPGQRAYQRFVEQPIRAEHWILFSIESWSAWLTAAGSSGTRCSNSPGAKRPIARPVQKRSFRLDWPLLQQRVAELKAEPWSPFAERRNDEGRDLALYVTRALAATPWPSWANCLLPPSPKRWREPSAGSPSLPLRARFIRT